MKRFVLLIGLMLSTIAYPQSVFQEGQNCFDNGDYSCAQKQYRDLLNSSNGQTQLTAELKLKETQWLLSKLKEADDIFDNGNFPWAKTIYEKILDMNPNDSYVKDRIEKCSQQKVLILDAFPGTLTFKYRNNAAKIVKVEVNSGSTWRVVSFPDWTTAEKSKNNLTREFELKVTCRKNPRRVERSGDVDIESSDGLSKTIRITQESR